jgi:uncharacterized protein YjbJ (UPF0337 family)
MNIRNGRCVMKRAVVGAVLRAGLVALAAAAAGTKPLTVNSILAAQQSGGPADGIIAMVNSQANTIAMTVRKQEPRGRVGKLQGRVKEVAGTMTGNRKLEREVSRQRTGDAVQESVGKAPRKVVDLEKRGK